MDSKFDLKHEYAKMRLLFILLRDKVITSPYSNVLLEMSCSHFDLLKLLPILKKEGFCTHSTGRYKKQIWELSEEGLELIYHTYFNETYPIVNNHIPIEMIKNIAKEMGAYKLCFAYGEKIKNESTTRHKKLDFPNITHFIGETVH
jgi:hypothetical protein